MKYMVLVLVVLLGMAIAACAGAPTAATPLPAAPTPTPPTSTPVPPTPTPLPPTSTPGVTVDDLIGVWLATKTGMDYVQFNADGTYRHAKAIPWLEMAPVEVGQFQLEGTLLTFISGNDSQECRGQSGSYEVELMETGQLQLVLQEDACQYRANYRPGPRERIPPTPAPSSLSVEDLTGLWYDADRKEYLQLNQDGTYRVAHVVSFLEADPYEVGQFRLEGGSFTFITSDESPDCKGQTGRYQVELTEEGRLQFALEEDACQARAAEQPGSWDRVPPEPAPSSITVEDLIGIWQNVDDKQYLQFREDGTYSVSSYITGLEEYPFEVGQFRLEGTSFTLITSDESRWCRGQQGSYKVELTEQGRLHFELQEDPCQIRISFQSGLFDPVFPAPVPSSISVEDLIGIWSGALTVGTERVKYVFQFNDDGTWRAARAADLIDCCPTEWGQFQLEGTSLTFSTSDESAFCKGQTGSYQVKLAEKDQLQFVLSEDQCSTRTSIVIEPWSRASP